MFSIKVIGIGGIGSNFLLFFCRYINYKKEEYRLTLVDGDEVENKNLARQALKSFGNKALVKVEELGQEFKKISFRAIPEYVGPENIAEIIESGDIVFLCVDNHETRKLVSDHCEKLRDIVLISGGNELIDGNVQVYIRRSGKNLTNPITKFHPEITNATGKTPAEMSCEELAARPGGEQILVANVGTAFHMFENFWKIENGMVNKVGETYFDLVEGAAQTIVRKVGDEVKKRENKTGRKVKNRAKTKKGFHRRVAPKIQRRYGKDETLDPQNTRNKRQKGKKCL